MKKLLIAIAVALNGVLSVFVRGVATALWPGVLDAAIPDQNSLHDVAEWIEQDPFERAEELCLEREIALQAVREWAASSLTSRSPRPLPDGLPERIALWLPTLAFSDLETLVEQSEASLYGYLFFDLPIDRLAPLEGSPATTKRNSATLHEHPVSIDDSETTLTLRAC